MNQIIHILRKDTRHLWLQIVVSMLVLVAYAFAETRQWLPERRQYLWLRSFIGPAIFVLVPISWWSLITRSIHDEPLVGDRHYWLTRPYEWHKLLAAKILFALVFINIPLFILQMTLLGVGGFSPWRHIPAILGMQAGLAVVLMLPAVALATITATLGQFLLALLCVVVYVIGIAFLGSKVPNSAFSGGVDDWLTGTVVLAGTIAIVLFQYAWRRTTLSRWIAAAVLAAVPLILVLLPYNSLIAHDYPEVAAGDAAPMQLVFQPWQEPPKHSKTADGVEGDVTISLPMLATGVLNDSSVIVVASRVSINNSMVHWTSVWHGAYETFFPGRRVFATQFTMNRETFDKIKLTPLDLQISYLLHVFHRGKTETVVASAADFNISEVGICRVNSGAYPDLLCRSAFGHPAFLTKMDNASSTCAFSPEHPRPQGEAYDWNGYGNVGSAISPVESFGVSLRNVTEQSRESGPRICPETPLTVTIMHPGPQLMTHAQANGVRLEDYRYQRLFDFSSFGISIH